MTRNGRHQPARPRIELGDPASASPEEAAAIAAAIEGFLRDTAPVPSPSPAPTVSPWARAALFEGTGREPGGPSPWGDPEAWGP